MGFAIGGFCHQLLSVAVKYHVFEVIAVEANVSSVLLDYLRNEGNQLLGLYQFDQKDEEEDVVLEGTIDAQPQT